MALDYWFSQFQVWSRSRPTSKMNEGFLSVSESREHRRWILSQSKQK